MVQDPPKLGPFELLRRLGAGGMAETFLAVRRGPAGFEQRVCIKRILPAYESDREFVAAFLDEARTSAALRHANIVQVVDFGLNPLDGSHYLALELVDGMDLRALMEQHAELDADLVTLIASDLAAALEHAHATDEGRAPVVHRDLSPSNVLISRAGEIKLTDFGIARAIGGAHRTASGVIKGKIPYMPPEYVEGGRFDARGDLFALGVLIFELLHGRRPFDGDSELDTLRKIAAGERRPFDASAPPALVACVDRLLQRDPVDRFEDAHALLDALPAVPVHQARRRLAALVRARTSHTSVLDAVAVQPTEHQPLQLPRTIPLPPARPLADPRTQTPARAQPPASARQRSLLPSRTALLALSGSLFVLLCVAALALTRGGAAISATTARPPRLPTWPGAVAAAPPEAPSLGQTTATALHTNTESARPTSHDTKPAAPARDLGAATPVSTAEVPDTTRDLERRPADEHGASRDEARTTKRELAELYVVVYPFGDVWVDDKPAGPAPLSLHLAPGSHEIAVGEGRARERQTVRLRSGESRHLTFRSSPAP